MKTLFLDDDVERHIVFRARHPEAIQMTYQAMAKIELENEPWDEVWLDHDLGYIGDPADNVLRNGSTFVHDVRPLVRWIAFAKPDVKHFVVHSWNNGGAMWMAGTLRDAGYRVTVAPFSFQPVEVLP
jgi:hypothetical protein